VVLLGTCGDKVIQNVHRFRDVKACPVPEALVLRGVDSLGNMTLRLCQPMIRLAQGRPSSCHTLSRWCKLSVFAVIPSCMFDFLDRLVDFIHSMAPFTTEPIMVELDVIARRTQIRKCAQIVRLLGLRRSCRRENR